MKKIVKEIILMHPVKFVCEAFKEFCNDLDVNVYTFEDFDEFFYLIDELEPSLVIIHTNILIPYEKQVSEQLDKAKFEGYKLISWGTDEDMKDINLSTDGVLIEPIDLGNLEDIFESLLAQSH